MSALGWQLDRPRQWSHVGSSEGIPYERYHTTGCFWVDQVPCMGNLNRCEWKGGTENFVPGQEICSEVPLALEGDTFPSSKHRSLKLKYDSQR